MGNAGYTQKTNLNVSISFFPYLLLHGAKTESLLARFAIVPYKNSKLLYSLSYKSEGGAKMRNRALILLLLAASSLVCIGIHSEVKAQENISILSTTIYQTYGYAPFSNSKGDYIVAGEVKNFGSEAQQFNITATFYDASGSILGTSYLSNSLPDASPCYLHVLLPNQRSPFSVWFSRFDEQSNFRLVDRYDLVATTSPAGIYHPSLEIISNSSHEAGSTLYVEGNIENIGSSSIDSLSVFVTYYKENGDILAVSMEGTRGLAPNETAVFLVPLNGFNEGGRLEEIYRYEVTTEGYDNSLCTADGQLINPEVVYVLGAPEEIIPPVEPAPTSPYTAYLVAVVLIIIILAIAILFLKRARKRAPTKDMLIHKQSP
jgi:hypothetical protein